MSDFDPATDAVPVEQMLEIDRYALARAAELQQDILAHYRRYEIPPRGRQAAAVLLGRPGRLLPRRAQGSPYTTVAKSRHGAAQTALYQIFTMLRWMAPFLSFTVGA